MSAVATRRRSPLVVDPPAAERPEPRLFEPRAGGVTLEDSILGTWEDLTAIVAPDAPSAAGGCGSRPAASGCGSELS